MAIETAKKRWTRDELERFPRDGNRYEVLDGELLVTPQAAIGHQIIALRLTFALHVYCEAHRVGVTVGPGAVIFGDSELQPDCEVLRRDPKIIGKKWEEMPYPALVAEVLSPSGAARRRDLETKRQAYLKLGIKCYWAVDQDARCVHAWSGDDPEQIVSDTLRWQPDPAIAAFEIRLDSLFAPVSAP